MNKLHKIALSALSTLVLVGCADLDTEPLSSTVTTAQKENVVASDPSKIEASVTAISSNFTVYGAIYGEDQHNDFGYPSLMLFTDSRGTDMVGFDIGYNWFGASLTLEDVTNKSVTTHMFWGTLYKQIFAANAVIATIDPETEDPQSQYYLAQALAVRAFDYFTLVQLYQFNYVGNESKLGVPIITPENKDDAAVNGLARSTVQETYDFILKDINKAIELLDVSGVKRADKRYVSLDVAYGIRARINLVMQNWTAALSDAENAIANTSATPYTMEQVSDPAFIDINDNSWMWGVLITEKDRVSTTGICNFPSHMGSLNYGYASVGAWRLINKKLFASIPDSDVRRGWFLDENAVSANLSEKQQAYVDDAGCPPYTQVKFAAMGDEMGTDDNACDVPLMRIEEMYLIKAEAEAMSGNTTLAVQTLESFVKAYRNPNYVCMATTKEEIQDAVWFQRRIELWGEGMSWFDIMRLNKGINRLGGGFPATGVFNIKPNDGVMIFAIPEAEEQYNKLIVNNEVVDKPDPITDEE